MPRHNHNAVQPRRVARATHLLIRRETGRIYASGTKREMVERAELGNATWATQCWIVAPIHK